MDKEKENYDDQSNYQRSVDNLTGASGRPKSNINLTHAYINSAFSFLRSDDYGAYKYYDDRDGRDDFMQLAYPQKDDPKGAERQKAGQLKLALVVVLLLLALLGIALGAVFGLGLLESDREIIFGDDEVWQQDSRISTDGIWLDDYYNKSSERYQRTAGQFDAVFTSIWNESDFRDTFEGAEVISITPTSEKRRRKKRATAPLIFLTRSQYSIAKKPPTASQGKVLLEQGFKTKRQEGTSPFDVIDVQVEEPMRVKKIKTTDQPPLPPSGSEVPETTTMPPTNPPPQYRKQLPPPQHPVPVVCQSFIYASCATNGYRVAGYPNVFGNKDFTASLTNLRDLKSLVQYDCYDRDDLEKFVCTANIPACDLNGIRKYPCKSYCQEFLDGCKYPIACNLFPDEDDEQFCFMSSSAKQNQSNEEPIPDSNPCNSGRFRCADDTTCVGMADVCDGSSDCIGGEDEANCRPQGQVAYPFEETMACDFENGDTCQWSNDEDSSDFNWVVNKGATPSHGTGPYWDHTHRDESGGYLLSEATGQYKYYRSTIISPAFEVQEPYCLRFYYHMRGSQTYMLRVLHNDFLGNETQLWHRMRDGGTLWHFGYTTVPPGEGNLKFQAVKGEGYRGDIAIDDITFLQGACPEQECEKDQFMCANGMCIEDKYKCNRETECLDYSDEIQCECEQSDEWKCGMGLCIPSWHRCDGKVQCPDGSDEDKCDECPPGTVACADDKSCIMPSWYCDRQEDCQDGSDELNCGVCSAAEWQCRDYSCIPAGQRCDGQVQCEDDSDEAQCYTIADYGGNEIVHIDLEGIPRPLCYEGISTNIATELCIQMGNIGLQVGLQSKVSYPIGQASFAKLQSGDGSSPAHFIISSSCPYNLGTSIMCTPKECGRPKMNSLNIPSPYIIGGRDTELGRWPWHVGLYRTGAYKCGGTIIGPRHIVTAAHCIDNLADTPVAFTVSTGELTRTQAEVNRQTFQVKSIEVHDAYTHQRYYWKYDIAVLVLYVSIEFNDYIQPICLPEAETPLPEHSICYTTGWGLIDYSSQRFPEKLQESKVGIIPFDECVKGHPNIKDSDDLLICAGHTSAAIANCQGDSGGQLACLDDFGRWELHGVFSFGPVGCDVPERPSVFTRVTGVYDWLTDTIECQFKCNNGACLLSAGDVCNVKNDCGDWSDEWNLECQSKMSMQCEFEDNFMCGYTNDGNAVSPWTQQCDAIGDNTGPTTDFTSSFSNTSGCFMYAGRDKSVLYTPLVTITGKICISFRYHMRSENPGKLRVFKYSYTGPLDSVNVINIPSDEKQDLVEISGNQGDDWKRWSFTLEDGVWVVGFEATGVDTQADVSIAIDSIHAQAASADGTCPCGPEESACSSTNTCVLTSSVCNLHPDCPDSTDESQCADPQYLCDMETYAQCGLVQWHQDDLDWRLVQPESDNFNMPPTDHSGFANGHFLHMDTRTVSPTGWRAILTLSLSQSSGPHCLTLHYAINSKGALKVYGNQGSDRYLLWVVEKIMLPDWRVVEVNIPASLSSLDFEGVVGSDSPAQESYVTLDDIRVDNQQCTNPACPVDQFTCSDGSCIPSSNRCNGAADCPSECDGAATCVSDDEEGCLCGEGELTCDDGTCISNSKRCDNVEDCVGGRDERECQVECYKESQFACGGSCHDNSKWCNNLVDCRPGGEDEGPDCECKPGYFQCNDLEPCLHGNKYCDGNKDCNGGEDEPANCDPLKYYFQCTNDTNYQVALSFRCNRFPECPDSSDEFGCECTSEEFACGGTGPCVKLINFCDGIRNCPNGEDEADSCYCGGPEQVADSPDYFRCKADDFCRHNKHRCDGNSHECFDLSDELDCECAAGDFQCSNGLCKSNDSRCDGALDCLTLQSGDDFSDEQHCNILYDDENKPYCDDGKLLCDNGLCMSRIFQCDGDDNCYDGTDELFCDEECTKNGMFMCEGSGKCIPMNWVCDGSDSCSLTNRITDRSDEQNCLNGTHCASGIYCGDHCVTAAEICDGQNQCPDGSDEDQCVETVMREGSSGVLHVQYKGVWSPVCSSGWQSAWNQQVCNLMNKGSHTSTSYLQLDSEIYLTSSGADFTISQISTDSCLDGRVVQVFCQEIPECGTRIPQIDRPSTYIISGDEAEPGEYPWLAAIYADDAYICVGAIISPTCILTAAHCFYPYGAFGNPDTYHILAGSNDRTERSSPTAERVAVDSFVHPSNYDHYAQNALYYNDVGVIKLRESLPYHDYSRPICRENKEFTFTNITQCYAAGWGLTKHDRNEGPAKLRDTRVEVIDDSMCDNAWHAPYRNDTQLCIGWPHNKLPHGTCNGDSGTPLLCREGAKGKWYTYGVLSFGPKDCDHFKTNTYEPQVFTDLYPYYDWVQTECGLS